MWALLCPIETGTPFSRLDMRDSVVDTGTQADENDAVAAAVIESVRSRGLD